MAISPDGGLSVGVGLSPTAGIGAGGISAISAAPAYTGPLDLVPGADWMAYSEARALASSMLGENGYTLRATDDAELAYAYDAVTGEIDGAAITAWKNFHGNRAYHKELYDHGGSVTLSQATKAKQPEWLASQINSKPSISFNASATHNLFSAGDVTWSTGAAYVLAVINLTDDGVSSNNMFGVVEGDYDKWLLFFLSSLGSNAGQFYDELNDGTNAAGGTVDSVASSVGTLVLIEAGWQFGEWFLTINGVNITQGASLDVGGVVGVIVGKLCFGCAVPDEGGGLNGLCPELLLKKSIPTAPQRSTLRTDIATYYGITL